MQPEIPQIFQFHQPSILPTFSSNSEMPTSQSNKAKKQRLSRKQKRRENKSKQQIRAIRKNTRKNRRAKEKFVRETNASIIEFEQSITCVICLFPKYRSLMLVNCRHSFCSICIHQHIIIGLNEDLTNLLQCSLCRAPILEVPIPDPQTWNNIVQQSGKYWSKDQFRTFVRHSKYIWNKHVLENKGKINWREVLRINWTDKLKQNFIDKVQSRPNEYDTVIPFSIIHTRVQLILESKAYDLIGMFRVPDPTVDYEFPYNGAIARRLFPIGPEIQTQEYTGAIYFIEPTLLTRNLRIMDLSDDLTRNLSNTTQLVGHTGNTQETIDYDSLNERRNEIGETFFRTRIYRRIVQNHSENTETSNNQVPNVNTHSQSSGSNTSPLANLNSLVAALPIPEEIIDVHSRNINLSSLDLADEPYIFEDTPRIKIYLTQLISDLIYVEIHIREVEPNLNSLLENALIHLISSRSELGVPNASFSISIVAPRDLAPRAQLERAVSEVESSMMQQHPEFMPLIAVEVGHHFFRTPRPSSPDQILDYSSLVINLLSANDDTQSSSFDEPSTESSDGGIIFQVRSEEDRTFSMLNYLNIGHISVPFSEINANTPSTSGHTSQERARHQDLLNDLE
jgi:hypothetical protein